MILFLTHFCQNSSPLCRREQKLETGEEREDDNAASTTFKKKKTKKKKN